MLRLDHSALEEIAEALQAAIGLLTQGRYADLAEQAAATERRASALAQQRPAWAGGQPLPEDIRIACQALKQKVFVLSEILRHATLVRTGWLEIERTAEGGYSRDGRCESGSSTHLSEEA